MRLWKASINERSHKEQPLAWQQAMNEIYIPSCQFNTFETDSHANVSSLYSPQGIELSILSGSPMQISGRSGVQPFYLWMAYLIEGDYCLKHGNIETEIPAESIIYAPTNMDMTLTIKSNFRLLYIKIPKTLINNRLINSNLIAVGSILCKSGINRVFASMLATLSDNFDHLEDDLIGPIENALTEFILTNLVNRSRLQKFGCASKLIHFNQICQYINANLTDPELSLNQIADHFKVSSRYIQKLFEQTEESFISYVRTRRLERCSFELSRPEYDHLSVSDICFRWGFNDAGHFSRTFRKYFGSSPREYRRGQLVQREDQLRRATAKYMDAH